MTQDHRNMIIAVVLSLAVVIGWQYFVITPQVERAAQQAEIAAQQSSEEGAADLATPEGAVDLATPRSAGDVTETAGAPSSFASREEAIASNARIAIDTPSLTGSINLVGGRIDDLSLKNYRETVDPESPIVSLLSPASGPEGYYVEQGWVPAGGSAAVPDSTTLWSVSGNSVLSANNPVTLTFDTGEGLIYSREITVDENYLFTINQSVQNNTQGDVALFPYSRIARYGIPDVEGFFILHEGAIGVLGDENLVERSYGDLQDELQHDVETTGGWLGFVDKYWAAAIMPEPDAPINARMSWNRPGQTDIFQTSFVGRTPVIVPSGGDAAYKSYVFAGAKVESVIAGYEERLGIDRLELLIDWGWFHFITKPMFFVIRWLFGVLGNFGLAILAVTVMVKAVFFPLANRSYASMAAMRKVQPEMKAIQERFKDDRAAQQKATMELYSREKINPISGCWPVLIQIPVFFSLYKVLFVTIEMRHAPFFGWIQDLAAQDPTNVFNLFGLLPYDPTALPVIGSFL
ncbi:MAG TPA: membrane protein insertase YidC, partial [Devosia sp.]|nr:membrane protein insertase YidC [Devosia sp.]